MKTSRFLAVFLLGALLSSAQVFGADGGGSDLQWGEASGQLQMAAHLDVTNAAIHCFVRNGGPREIAYNDFYFGYFEEISLQMRQGSDWVDLTAQVYPNFGYSSAGPASGQIKHLPPGQIMTATESKRRGRWDGGRDFAALEKSSAGDTFTIDLHDVNWPSGTDAQSPLELRVIQRFGAMTGDKREYEPKMLTLISPTCLLEKSAVWMFKK